MRRAARTTNRHDLVSVRRDGAGLHRVGGEKLARKIPRGGVPLLENLRFHAEEEANDGEPLVSPVDVVVSVALLEERTPLLENERRTNAY